MKAPTDLELMMFADGELAEPRSSEVARFLASAEGADGGLKLLGMSIVGDLARDHADRLATIHGADDIAARVLARIEEDPSAEDSDGRASADHEVFVDGVRVVRRASEGAARPAPRRSEGPGLPGEKRLEERSPAPANDNHRFIYGLAAVAAAAAVALGFWGRSAPPDSRVAGREPIVHEVPSELPVPASGEVAVKRPVTSATAPAEAAEDEPSVKVASVNFGTNTGTIYYVPKDTPGTTTVVWLADR